MFIREMAKRVHLSEDTLRYYEKIGLLAHVTRDAGGHRVYGEVEIEEVQKIVYLKASGLSLNDIRNYLELMQGGKEGKEQQHILLLATQKTLLRKMVELQQSLKKINQLLYTRHQTCMTAGSQTVPE
ncbi:MerR family transcriptional regulator [Megasphaera sp. DJF_B143]|uniref:MerR family transcriptional regulator n=1 Tax=Megasphaera sp. DJF_B143 TaxID=537288 RepID=UPI00073F43EE|nr:MerR family transcriptional regulator [Megasphaera sp. DJF_B143]KUH55609.1 hypothetical protein AT798_06445 [Megasphaera sp. DJF_B143]